MEWKAILAVGIGGGIGTILRYVIGLAFVQRFGPGFPWGTFFINITGSFVIGVIAQLALTRSFGVTPAIRLFAATGVLGGYTTFSTFSLDTLVLASDGAIALSAAYSLGSVAAGLLAAYAGTILTRLSVG